MVSSEILLGYTYETNSGIETSFVRVNEGSGTNLLQEDIEEGFVDYIMIDFLEYDGYEFIETDGAQVMLSELYQVKFHSVEEVIKHLIDTSFLPDVKYMILNS